MNTKTRYTSLLIALLCGFALVMGSKAAYKDSNERQFNALGYGFVSEIKRFAKSRGCVVISEVPSYQIRANDIGKDCTASPGRFLSDWNLDLQKIGRVAILHQQYTDPRADHSIEVEELTRISEDVYRHVNSVFPHSISAKNIEDQIWMFESLSEKQKERARTGRLLFQSLRPDQQRIWMRINAAYAYGIHRQKAERCLEAFDNWPRVSIHRLRLSNGKFRVSLSCINRLGREEKIQLGAIGGIIEKQKEASKSHVGRNELQDVMSIQDEKMYPFLKQNVQVLSGQLLLQNLIEILCSATGMRIEVPSYSKQRKVIVFAEQASVGEIITGIQNLYGWRLRASENGGYILDRPKVEPTDDAKELHSAIRSALPPSIHHLWGSEKRLVAKHRQLRRLTSINDRIEKQFGGEWTVVDVLHLDPETQRRLAAMVFDELLMELAGRYIHRKDPPAWIVSPSHGFFTLTGGGPNPLFMFRVIKSNRKVDSWGWYIGTSSIEKQKARMLD